VDAGSLHRLARTLRQVALTASADAREAPVSAGQLAIVEDVAHHGPTSIGEIAGRTGHAQSLVSNTVALMKRGGVFQTAADPADGRRVLVSVSPRTRTEVFAVRARRPIAPALAQLRPDLSDRQRARAERLLEQLAALLD
jgi:DNA-binding MarR family transcriptional regulator